MDMQHDKEARTELYRAAISCGHEIDAEQVILYRDPKKPGNALAQLADRLDAAHSALLSQQVEAARNAALEEAAKVAEGGRFLHDDAPDARFGKACAKAIRALSSPAEQKGNV